MNNTLHLPNLTIKGFRGIDQLTIPRLGRVTLIAGKNGVGKSTVLEAVRVYAARGRYSVLVELLRSRQEISIGTFEDGEAMTAVHLPRIFFEWNTSQRDGISIGPKCGPELVIKPVELTDKEKDLVARFSPLGSPTHAVKAIFEDSRQCLWLCSSGMRDQSPESRRVLNQDDLLPEVKCQSLGPEIMNDVDLSRLWDRVALTDDENQTVKSLELILGVNVERVGMVGDPGARGERLAVVRLRGYGLPIPLKSLGDGAVRLFGVALTLANSRNGFLLIDEAENGIHHSVQYDLWKMILRTAQANDVQVLATTHSWDCVRGFAYAAAESGESEGVLVRLDRDDRGLRAVEYSEEDLKIAYDPQRRPRVATIRGLRRRDTGC